LLIHFQENEVMKAAFVQAPRGAQARNTAAYNDDRMLLGAAHSREGRTIAKLVAQLEGIIDKRTGDRTITLD
jgi:hypothetical protein